MQTSTDTLIDFIDITDLYNIVLHTDIHKETITDWKDKVDVTGCNYYMYSAEHDHYYPTNETPIDRVDGTEVIWERSTESIQSIEIDKDK